MGVAGLRIAQVAYPLVHKHLQEQESTKLYKEISRMDYERSDKILQESAKVRPNWIWTWMIRWRGPVPGRLKDSLMDGFLKGTGRESEGLAQPKLGCGSSKGPPETRQSGDNLRRSARNLPKVSQDQP